MSDNQDRALKSPEAIYRQLLRNENDIVVTASDAQEIWSFFGRRELQATHFNNTQYRAFLQACLMAAIEASEAMSWVEALFRGACKPTASLKSITIALAKAALKKYYNRLIGKSPEIYTSVRDSIAWSHRPYFDLIDNGLDL